RSLHRAFVDTVQMGPVGYLRRRRLSTIQTILKRSDPAKTSIAEIAFEHGFPEPSRFAAYYRSFFGETPSGTRQAAMREPSRFLRSQGDVDLAQTVLQA